MVPQSVVHLAELPLGRTGKVDRARLPHPPATRPELGRPFVTPTTGTERRLAEVWGRVLGLGQIGVQDNFFELGGNSIRLLAVLAALREQGDGQLTMVDLFRHPTIAALAVQLDRPANPGPSAADREASRRRGADRRERLAARTAQVRNPSNSAKGGTP
jgi:aryl carrier-like protein